MLKKILAKQKILFILMAIFIVIPICLLAGIDDKDGYYYNIDNGESKPIKPRQSDGSVAQVKTCITNNSDFSYFIPNKTQTEIVKFFNVTNTLNISFNACCKDGVCTSDEFSNGNCADCITDRFSLLYAAGPHGSLSGVTDYMVVPGNSGPLVTAVPHDGYHFVKWSDGNIQSVRQDTNVTKDIEVIALFSSDDFVCDYDDTCDVSTPPSEQDEDIVKCPDCYAWCDYDGICEQHDTLYGSCSDCNPLATPRDCTSNPCTCGLCDIDCLYYCPSGVNNFN